MTSENYEHLEERLDSLTDTMTARSEALRDFTLDTLHGFRQRLEEVDARCRQISAEESGLDDSVRSLREQFELFTSSPGETSTPKDVVASGSGKASPTFPGRKTKLSFVRPSKAETLVPETPPSKLEDVADEELRRGLSKHYSAKELPGPERLTAVQLAYLLLWVERKGGDFSARSSKIDELHRDGTKDGMWSASYAPAGIKGTFKEYLKEKLRNMNKRKLREEATSEFIDAYGKLAKKTSSEQTTIQLTDDLDMQ